MKKINYLFLFLASLLNAQTQIGNSINGAEPSVYFGSATAMSSNGNILAVGSPDYNGSETKTGLVNVYQYSNGNWNPYGSPIVGVGENTNFGSSISMSSNATYLAISGPGYGGAMGQNVGYVEVYSFFTGNWVKHGNTLYGADDNNHFGNSIALSGGGSRLAVGIPGYGVDNQRGRVQIYTLVNNIWTVYGNSIDAAVNDDNFGNYIAFSSNGNTVAIADYNGSFLPNSVGKIKIYSYSAGSWIQKGSDITGLISEDAVQKSVSLNNDGSILAIGVPGSSMNATYEGKVQVYSFSSNSWQQIGNDIIGTNVNERFGYTVKLSLDGSLLFIAAPVYNQRTGRVSIYKNISGNWVKIGADFVGEGPNEFLGRSLNISSNNDVLSISAPYKTINGDEYTGQVKVYNIGSVLSTVSETLSEAQLYPNPIINGVLFIKQPSNNPIKKADIYTITGALLQSYNLENSNTMDVKTISSGVYFVKLSVDDMTVTKKIIIQ